MQNNIFYFLQYTPGTTNRLYKQTCNVAFCYNNFNQILPIDMTFIAGCSLVAASFEREDARMCPFANLTCDY